MIRVLLVDDQNLVQQGIKVLLERDPEIKVVGTVKDGRSAMIAIEKLSPDVVLLDIEMPGMDGITATKYITRLTPQTKVIILSSHEDKKYLTRALMAGAKSYILKDSLMRDLRQSVISVNNGYTQIESRLLAKIFDPSNVKLSKSKKPATETQSQPSIQNSSEAKEIKVSAVAQNSAIAAEQVVFPDLVPQVNASDSILDRSEAVTDSASVIQHPSTDNDNDAEPEPVDRENATPQVDLPVTSVSLTDLPPVSTSTAHTTKVGKQPFPTTIAHPQSQLSTLPKQSEKSDLINLDDKNHRQQQKENSRVARYRAELNKFWAAKQIQYQPLISRYQAKSTQFKSRLLPIIKQWHEKGWLANAGLAILGLITILIIHRVFS